MWDSDRSSHPGEDKDSVLKRIYLNPEHSEGKHKATVFRSALGIGLEEADELRGALLEAVSTYDAIPDKSNQYGQKYVIDFSMTRSDKQAVVRSAWIVRYDENFPRLVTCYIL